MPKETMSPKERWQAVLTRSTPDRVPLDYWATPEVDDKIMKHLGCATMEEVYERLHIDRPLSVGSRYVGPEIGHQENIWGIRYKKMEYNGGTYDEVVYAPLNAYESVEEIEANYCFPSPDWYDYSHIPQIIKGQEHRPIRGGGSEPFLLYKELRGEVQANIDLIANPDIVNYLLDKLFDLAYENTRRIFEAIPGKVLITYIAEDFGSQTALLFSPQHIRRYLLPRMKRMMELTRQAGSYVFTHSDGAIRDIIPDLIDTGTQVLNPIQWRCSGMEREGLKRDFGDKLVFHGGVDNQETLPFGSADDVRKEVEDNLSILGRNGGYIVAPCHNIQAVSPAENIVAMYEHGYRLGWNV